MQMPMMLSTSGSVVFTSPPIGGMPGGPKPGGPPGGPKPPGGGPPPVKALGHEYVAVRYRNRTMTDEQPPWRLVGAVDKTTLTYLPTPPAGAPLTLNNGQVAEFKSAGPFTVSSQDALHPFYMSGHMTGGGQFGGIGDPEFVNVIPPQQWLASYVFFTDPTYPETNLIVIRKKNKAMQFSDVSLDCKGTLTGWQPI